jgi:hypothetical protein
VTVRYVAVVVAFTVLLACEKSSSLPARSKCVTGSVEFCACETGHIGTQVCDSVGRYEPCRCETDAGEMDAGVLDDAGVPDDAGTPVEDAGDDLADVPWWMIYMPDTTGCDTTDPAPMAAGTECRRETIDCVLACRDVECRLACYDDSERATCRPCLENVGFWCAARNGCDWLWQGFDCCRERRCGGLDTECLVRNCNTETAAILECWYSLEACAEAHWDCAPSP